MLNPVPVTLTVKIYDKVHNVQYPSDKRVKELMQEFATECKGRLKPGGNRRYFVCIHCGQDDFSNKLRLNQHRYESGCDAAVYPDGSKALLLPYPDFLPGQGKMVESIAKIATGLDRFSAANDNDAEICGEELKRSPSSREVKAPSRLSNRGCVPPPADLLYGVAPLPKLRKGPCKPRGTKKSLCMDPPAKVQQCSERAEVTAVQTKATVGSPKSKTSRAILVPSDPALKCSRVKRKRDTAVHDGPCKVSRKERFSDPSTTARASTSAVQERLLLLAMRRTSIQFEPGIEDRPQSAIVGYSPVQVMGDLSPQMAQRYTKDNVGVGIQHLDVSVGKSLTTIGVSEWDFASNKALLQFWADGEGSSIPFQFHPDIGGRIQERKHNLQQRESAHVARAQLVADEALRTLQRPTPPEEPKPPGVFHLKTFSDLVDLPWVWECSSGNEFRDLWNASYSTDEFQESLMRCLWWWTAKKQEKNLSPSVIAVKDYISQSLELLVSNRNAGEEYSELSALCECVQWTVDFAAYEVNIVDFEATVTAKIVNMVDTARTDFRRDHAWELETMAWDWCPFFKVLVGHPEVLKSLPSVPWAHNDTDCEVVRGVLLQHRGQSQQPPTLVFVIKMLFIAEYGVFRPLTCPTFGLTGSLITYFCVEGTKIVRAMNAFVHVLSTSFCDTNNDVKEVVLQRLKVDIARIRDGHGSDIVESVKAWVRSVQLRALQDHALMYPDDFKTAWCTTSHSNWSKQGEQWGDCLRVREAMEMGWVPGLRAMDFSPRVESLLSQMEQNARDTKRAITEEDARGWGFLQNTAVVEEYDQRTSPSTTRREQSSAAEVRSSPLPSASKFAIATANRDHTDPVALCSKIKTLAKVGEASEVKPVSVSTSELSPKTHSDHSPLTCESDPYRFDVPHFQQPLPIVDVAAKDALPPIATGVEDVASRSPLPRQGFLSTVDSEAEVLLRNDDVTVEHGIKAEATFSHWMVGPRMMENSAMKLVSMAKAPEGEDFFTAPRNLAESWQKEREMEVRNTLLDMRHGLQERLPPEDAGISLDPTVAGMEPTEEVLRSEDGNSNGPMSQFSTCRRPSLKDLYESSRIGELLQQVPSRGEGSVRKQETVFYNHCGKEIIVRNKDVTDLTKSKHKLGNDIVDFVLSRVYSIHADDIKGHIHVLSSYVSSSLRSTAADAKELQNFGRKWLQPPPGVAIDGIEELILPWICADHWSVLVFQPQRIIHMDSSVGLHHFPLGKHANFVHGICRAWQCFRGVEPYRVTDVIEKPVFQQRGGTECGQFSLRNAMMYMQYRTRDYAGREAELNKRLLEPSSSTGMHSLILSTFRKELNPTLRDKRFDSPFCPLRPQRKSNDKFSTVLATRGVDAPAIRRCTRADPRPKQFHTLEDTRR